MFIPFSDGVAPNTFLLQFRNVMFTPLMPTAIRSNTKTESRRIYRKPSVKLFSNPLNWNMSLLNFSGLIILAVKQSCDVLKMCFISAFVSTTCGGVIFHCRSFSWFQIFHRRLTRSPCYLDVKVIASVFFSAFGNMSPTVNRMISSWETFSFSKVKIMVTAVPKTAYTLPHHTTDFKV